MLAASLTYALSRPLLAKGAPNYELLPGAADHNCFCFTGSGLRFRFEDLRALIWGLFAGSSDLDCSVWRCRKASLFL